MIGYFRYTTQRIDTSIRHLKCTCLHYIFYIIGKYLNNGSKVSIEYERKIKEIQAQTEAKEDAPEVLHFLLNELLPTTKCCPLAEHAQEYINQFTGFYSTCIKCNKCKNFHTTSEQKIALKIPYHKNLEQDIFNYFSPNESDEYKCRRYTKANVNQFISTT